MAPLPPWSIFFSLSVLLLACGTVSGTRVCIVGAGISGSSVAYFLKHLTCNSSSSSPVPCLSNIQIIERSGRVGGRMATVSIAGDTFEAGASIIHPKNLHAAGFVDLLGLSRRPDTGDDSLLGIWSGSAFVFKPLAPPTDFWVVRKLYSLLNSLRLIWRYGFSLMKMKSFSDAMLEKFLKFYEGIETRPVFTTVEEMLQWSGLYELTQKTLKEALIDAGVSPLLISELITVITRVNYGQDVSISGLAGAVSIAGSDDGLWAVNGGNWQIASGLIELSNPTLVLHEEIISVTYEDGHYILASKNGTSYSCEITVIATPLDEVEISFSPTISIPKKTLQHTFTTFVRGCLNPKYFGVDSVTEIPDLVGTLEETDIPFSSISVLKRYSKDDNVYKIFSRKPTEDELLDQLFSNRNETIRLDWAAYPRYEAPETFSPIVLDGLHLYYINAFERAASAIETGAVAAENVARLIVSRMSGQASQDAQQVIEIAPSGQEILHTDL